MTTTKKVLTLFVLFLAFNLFLNSQVTIGMDKEPIIGSLLDLKNQETNVVTNANSTMGLSFPRVELVDIDVLRPMYDNNVEATDPTNKSTHMGLLVYNVTYDTDRQLYPGMYVWDGEQWTALFNIPAVEVKDLGANSYILAPGATVDISLKRVYDIWRTHADLGNMTLTGVVTTEIHWQDSPALISSASLPQGDQGEASVIRVTANATNTEGNGVVVVKMDGIVRWSWHIWVTNYNPNDVSGQKHSNNVTFMDRHLGAKNTIPGNPGSFGLLYQWGRKDPFPGSANTLKGEEPVLVGNQINRQDVTEFRNLMNSIANPLTFYTLSVPPYDWYTKSVAFQNENLWNNQDGKKAAFDPCPYGWRVPVSGDGNLSPWFGLTQPNFAAGTGADWGAAGFYPVAGQRSNYNGNFNLVGTSGLVWSASPTYDDGSYELIFNSWEIDASRNSRRGEAYSVRCVKE